MKNYVDCCIKLDIIPAYFNISIENYENYKHVFIYLLHCKIIEYN